jgi:hypothetical protein
LKRQFIYSRKFDREWAAQGLTDDEQQGLEKFLLENPEIGDIMEGTGGLRKVRWRLPERGKSGSVRVLYVDFEHTQIICLVDLFAKNEKENLTKAERNEIKKTVMALKEELGK